VAEFVYGIVAADATAPTEPGIRGAPVRLVAGDGMAALVSELEEEQVRLGRDEVLLHSRVLEHALANGTVLPMRFGVVMSDAAEICERILDEHADELRDQLAEMTGKVEIRIRATYDEQALLSDVLRENQEIASLRDSLRGKPDDATYYERIRLGELIAAAVEHRREHDARAIVAALSPAAVAVDDGKPGHERVVVNASFLVARDALKRFDKLVDDVAEEQAGRIRFKYTGPLPPYSFVRFAERV
jgi:hypothetical protein